MVIIFCPRIFRKRIEEISFRGRIFAILKSGVLSKEQTRLKVFKGTMNEFSVLNYLTEMFQTKLPS